MLELFLTLLASFIVFVLIYYFLIIKSKKLKNSFESLGNVKGLDKKTIINKLGNYTTFDRIDNETICTWNSGGYTLVLTFDSNDKVTNVIEKNETFWS